jgi:hypothetical protein
MDGWMVGRWLGGKVARWVESGLYMFKLGTKTVFPPKNKLVTR